MSTPPIPDTHDAERELLSILLNEPYALSHLEAFNLSAASFTSPAHREMFVAIKAIYERGDDPGLASVTAEMERRGTYARLEPGDLETIATSLVPASQATGLARQVEVARLYRLAESSADRREYDRAAEFQHQADALLNSDETGAATICQPPPLFPVDALPDPVRSLVIEGAAASDIDPAFVALPILGIVGGLIGPKVALELKRGWRETAQLWLAVVAEPGRGKTPGEKHARTGLEKLQSEAFATYEEALDQYEADLSAWSSSPGDDRGPKPPPPSMTSYYSADVTMEALAGMLGVRPGMVILRDELVSWVRACDAYRGGKGGDRQAWLSLWSGVPVKVDRKTGKPVYIEHPVVSVAGGIQPDMLPALAEEANRRDGFIERMLFAFPADHVPGWTDDEIDVVTIRAVENQLRAIDALEPADEPIRLSQEARAMWVAWYDDTAQAQASLPGVIGGVYAKLPVQLARLTLILHVLKSTTSTSSIGSEIPAETLEDASVLADYFRQHAHRIVPFFGEAATAIPGLTPERRRILDYHRQHGPATSREVSDALELPYRSVNNMHGKLVRQGFLYQPAYGSYGIAPSPDPESTSDGSNGFSGNSQELPNPDTQVLRDSTSSTKSIGSENGACQECGGPTNDSGLCLNTDCAGYDPDAKPF